MFDRNALSTIAFAAAAFAAALAASLSFARAFDDAQYPDFSGQWVGVRLPVGGQPGFDPTKPWGLGQQAPLTPEYQKVLEASVADQAAGGQGNWPTGADCLPPGMPAMMTAFAEWRSCCCRKSPTCCIDHAHDSHRRIYTDGRDWPKKVEPSFMGYSIGNWIDNDGAGRFDVLEVETRFFKGPRASTGRRRPHGTMSPSSRSAFSSTRRIPSCCTTRSPDRPRVHPSLDGAEELPPRPVANYPVWQEYYCSGDQELIKLGKETYYRGGDGDSCPPARTSRRPISNTSSRPGTDDFQV